MISRIALRNFKCFSDLSLSVSPLTVLCGVNGMGKSSLIQALLVLRQSYQSRDLLDGRLALSGSLADLGTGADVLFEGATEDVLAFDIESSIPGTPAYSITFNYRAESDQLEVQPPRTHRPPSHVPMAWRRLPPFDGTFAYVNAERLGPRKWHELSESRARNRDLGVRGEYVMNYLRSVGSSTVGDTDPRALGAVKLSDVLDRWLQTITPGAHLDFEAVQAADALIAGFKFDRPGDVASRRYRATNVGFGLSYVLPVVAALATTPPGALAIVENPEAHLHPRGQTKLGELAARAALAGVQVIVETHSDHFMDGVRIAVREGLIDATNVSFHYFTRSGPSSRVISPALAADGRISDWPPGFFDQHDENLARLLSPE